MSLSLVLTKKRKISVWKSSGNPDTWLSLSLGIQYNSKELYVQTILEVIIAKKCSKAKI